MLFKQSTAQVLYLNVARRKRNLKLQVEVAQIKRVYYLRFSSPTSPTVFHSSYVCLGCTSDLGCCKKSEANPDGYNY
jgi:hypothetical protein